VIYGELERAYVQQGRKGLYTIQWLWPNLSRELGSRSAISVNSEIVASYINARKNQRAGNYLINREISLLRRMYRLALNRNQLSTIPWSADFLPERKVRINRAVEARGSSPKAATFTRYQIIKV
jgi:hypothetical protein